MLGDFGEVYVMDWGLAKLVGSKQSAVGSEQKPHLAAELARREPHATTSPSSKVVTSREPDADLTQEGAILGTPVYMPPEQAMGDLGAIDARSDIYSLGAILYEMLTLQPPVEKEGGYLGILMRVCAGEIMPPEARVPQRAGKIPKELSAIAMKALAKNPRDRYQDVEALRRDIERFQEGRSVSAKEDSVREAVWKLVKRNKAASFISSVALILLVFLWGRMSWLNHQEQLRTEKERQAKFDQAKNSVPALVRAARLLVNEKQLDDALAQVNIALEYDQGNADAQLLKGKVLVVKQEFKSAQDQLQEYLRLRPDDEYAGKLIELSRRVDPKDPRTVAPIVELFLDNQEIALAMGMGDYQDKILAYYRERIEKAWPGLGKRLTLQTGGKLTLDLMNCASQVTDLSPLRKMPLVTLRFDGCNKVKDLTPLIGMQLTSLVIHRSEVSDLSPLRGMPLSSFGMAGCRRLSNLTPLRGMPLVSLEMDGSGVNDLTPLEGMNLKRIFLTPNNITNGMNVLREMKSLNTIDLKWPPKLTPAGFWKRYDAGEFNK